ncbi:MAG: DUF4494 domain-containing protein [Porphyromonas sp.]|nr:DUF4494 domain-containing protein [Porphyromonas sp.]
MVQWYECKVSYDRDAGEGLSKVNELYLVNAMNFTEAEARIIEYVQPFVSMGELEVTNIRRALFAELFFSEDSAHDRYFKARVNNIVFDERSGKEKKKGFNVLIQRDTLASALTHLIEQYGKGSEDYEVASIAETQLMDVVPYEPKS